MSEVMSELEKYDRAVYAYLAPLATHIVYSTTSNAVKLVNKKEEKLFKEPIWNFISYYRNPTFEIDWTRMNNPGTVSGDLVRVRGERVGPSVEARYVQNLPVNLTYNVDLWASKEMKVQEMAISLISKLFMQDQVIEVPINPDGEIGRFHLLDVSWSDNSDLERETDIGRIYRHTINFEIDARLTLVRDEAMFKLCHNIPISIYSEE